MSHSPMTPADSTPSGNDSSLLHINRISSSSRARSPTVVAQWMQTVFGMCMTSQKEIWSIGLDFVFKKFGGDISSLRDEDDGEASLTGHSEEQGNGDLTPLVSTKELYVKNPKLDEWLRRPNGALMVETMRSTFKSMIEGRCAVKSLPQQKFAVATGYVQYLNLPQLLHIRLHANSPRMRETWGGAEWTECSTAHIKEFANRVEETICELLVDAILSSSTAIAGAQLPAEGLSTNSTYPFSGHEKRFMGRKAIMHFGLINIYQESVAIHNRSSLSNERIPLPSNSLWYIFGGSKVPENESETLGFYFSYPELGGSLHRLDGFPVFCLAATKTQFNPTASIPWHILSIDASEPINTLIATSINFKGSAAPQQQPRGSATRAWASKEAFLNKVVCTNADEEASTSGGSPISPPSELNSPSKLTPLLEADADQTTNAQPTNLMDGAASDEDEAGNDAADGRVLNGDGEYPEQRNEGECEEWQQQDDTYYGGWDEVACDAWEKGFSLFYNTERECFIYYGAVCWVDDDNEALYYWDNDANAYAYLDEDSHAQIAEGLVPCFPQHEENEEEKATEEGVEIVEEYGSVGVSEAVEGTLKIAAIEAVEEVITKDVEKEEKKELSLIATTEQNVTESENEVALAISPRYKQEQPYDSLIKQVLPSTSSTRTIVRQITSQGSLEMRASPPPLAKSIPRPKNAVRSTQHQALKVNAIDDFRATDSTLFKDGVKFLQRLLEAPTQEKLCEWQKRPNGSIKVGKQKRSIEALIKGTLDAKSFSSTDLSIITASLSLLNIYQIVMIRFHGTATAWERSSVEAMKQFALKTDTLLGELLCEHLAMLSNRPHQEEDNTSPSFIELFKLLTVADKRFAGLQILLLLGTFQYATPSRHAILRTPPLDQVLLIRQSADCSITPPSSSWFVPCHPIAGATVPRGQVSTKPTGVFLSYPSLTIQFDRPSGPIYRLIRAQTSTTGAAHGWEVVELMDKVEDSNGPLQQSSTIRDAPPKNDSSS